MVVLGGCRVVEQACWQPGNLPWLLGSALLPSVKSVNPHQVQGRGLTGSYKLPPPTPAASPSFTNKVLESQDSSDSQHTASPPGAALPGEGKGKAVRMLGDSV